MLLGQRRDRATARLRPRAVHDELEHPGEQEVVTAQSPALPGKSCLRAIASAVSARSRSTPRRAWCSQAPRSFTGSSGETDLTQAARA